MHTPQAHKDMLPHSFVDSLFMSASAVCVTGLTTIDIYTNYTIFGQMILLFLFQIGGLGYMTLATVVASLIGRVSLKDRLILREVIDLQSFEGIRVLLKYILAITVVFESIGAIILTACFLPQMTLLKAVYFGIFHSVSAFNNCGMGLWNNSLEGFRSDPVVLITAMFLIISGGLGFLVINELLHYRKVKRLSVHTRVVLFSTAALIAIGTIYIFAAEFTNQRTLGPLPLGEKILTACFQAVVPRTAGFNSVPISGMHEMTLFFLLILMFIGASPGGTGGGIKTTTFAIIVSTIWATIRGRQETNLLNGRISDETIKKSITISSLAITMLFISSALIFSIEKYRFLDILFEVTSALGTVGLSTGITSRLSDASKLIIVATMLIGRIGPLTIGIALLQKDDTLPYKYPEERVMIG